MTSNLLQELYNCLCDVLDADGDLYAMDFDRYRRALDAAKDAGAQEPARFDDA